MSKILIVIPAYNEQDVIKETVAKLENFTNQNNDYDYIVVDDGSTDNTRMLLKECNAKFISHPINLGIGEPFKTGIKYGLELKYQKFINFDADGQHRLSEIEKLISLSDSDYIVGSRFVTEKKPLSFRMFGSRILSIAIKLKTGTYIADPTSGLLVVNNRQFAKFFISQASNKPEPSLYPKIVKKFKVSEVQVTMDERLLGSSHFNAYNSIHFMLEQLFLIILKG